MMESRAEKFRAIAIPERRVAWCCFAEGTGLYHYLESRASGLRRFAFVARAFGRIAHDRRSPIVSVARIDAIAQDVPPWHDTTAGHVALFSAPRCTATSSTDLSDEWSIEHRNGDFNTIWPGIDYRAAISRPVANA